MKFQTDPLLEICRNNTEDEANRNRSAHVPRFSGRNVATLDPRSCCRTIAISILAPCSVSSMLFATLRPGRRPGLRALTTPPRGTTQAITRCWSSADFENVIDAGVAQAYVGFIASVPHCTPFVRPKDQRSAHPVGAHRARHRAQSQHRRLMHDNRERFVGALLSCEPRYLSPAHHPQDRALRRDAFTSGMVLPWFD